MKILAINPGATSTKIALFDDTTEIARKEFVYAAGQLPDSDDIFDQIPTRYRDIETALAELGYGSEGGPVLDAVVGRGGLIGPVKPGAYEVSDALLDTLRYHPVLSHASNLGGALSREAARSFGSDQCKVLIYDPVTVDEISPVCRITGLKEIERESIGHHLNMRKVAIDLAEKLGKTYSQATIGVVHMGGGSSASMHVNGKVVDFISDDEIQFSVERSGGLPLKSVVRMMRAENLSVDDLEKRLRKEAGLVSHFHTSDAREVESLAVNGDQRAQLVLEAMALQIAKAMATLAVSATPAKVDAFILTGGIAHSKPLCEMVANRIAFIAPLHPYPGEYEMAALAEGAYRVLIGAETAHQFTTLNEKRK